MKKLERKIDQYLSAKPYISDSKTSTKDLLERLRIKANPLVALQEAVLSGNQETVYELAPYVYEKMGKTAFVLSIFYDFAEAGDQGSAQAILEILLNPDEELSIGAIRKGVAALVQFYYLTERYTEGAEEIGRIVSQTIETRSMSNEEKASLLNQAQKANYSAGYYEKALSNAEHVNSLVPNDPNFKYNLSLIYNRLNMLENAVQEINEYMAVPKSRTDADLVGHALTVYARAGKVTEAKGAYEILKVLQPTRAEILATADEDVKKILEQN